MSQVRHVQDMSRPLEGGVFYPAGYIVVGFDSESDAAEMSEIFRQAGYDRNDCFVVSADAMLATAQSDLESAGVIAILGSSLQARQRQRELAEEGCSFLLVYAPSEAEKARVLRVLAQVPVRYAIHYHRFTIEDLIDRIPSAQEDAKTARSTGGDG